MNAPTPDTTNLRSGAPFNDSLLAVLPLVGAWRGRGAGVVPSTGSEFAYGQQITFAHDGRPFLAYEARAWLFDDHGAVLRQAWRETGFWRMGAGPDELGVVLASSTGQAIQLSGLATDLRWELQTSSIVPSHTAKQVDGERRLYGLIRSDAGEELAYATELAPGGREYAPHLQARLLRV